MHCKSYAEVAAGAQRIADLLGVSEHSARSLRLSDLLL